MKSEKARMLSIFAIVLIISFGVITIAMLEKEHADNEVAEASLDRFTIQRAGSLSDEYISVHLYLISDTERGGEYLLVRRLGGSEVDVVPLIDDSVSVAR